MRTSCANEELVLGRIREQELAEVAAAATFELQRLLARQSLLASANALLSSSLDQGDTQRAVTRLGVPELAECCIVRLTSSVAQRTTAAHVVAALDAQLVARDDELAVDTDLAALEVLALGDDEATYSLRLLADDRTDDLEGHPLPCCLLRALGARSMIALPLQARGQAFGVLFFVAFSERTFTPADLELAQELARRASTALDNATLFYEARQSSRLREDVLAIASHDLRSPLGAISMTAQGLLRRIATGDVERLRKALELILRATGHMSRLIEELLDVANIQRGHVALQRSRVRSNDLITRALEMFEQVAATKGVRMTARLATGDTYLTCDAQKMTRVIGNLVGNAIKFTPPGGSVEVSSSHADASLSICVADTGPGIAPAQHPKLFEQYWKGDQTGRIGMGLGLYIARGIVEAHGGTIRVESEPPHGSRFSVVLPRD